MKQESLFYQLWECLFLMIQQISSIQNGKLNKNKNRQIVIIAIIR